MAVSPLPSFAWQLAQWSAKCSRAPASTSLAALTGQGWFLMALGVASRRIARGQLFDATRFGASAEAAPHDGVGERTLNTSRSARLGSE
jgi:hypothetical protein